MVFECDVFWIYCDNIEIINTVESQKTPDVGAIPTSISFSDSLIRCRRPIQRRWPADSVADSTLVPLCLDSLILYVIIPTLGFKLQCSHQFRRDIFSFWFVYIERLDMPFCFDIFFFLNFLQSKAFAPHFVFNHSYSIFFVVIVVCTMLLFLVKIKDVYWALKLIVSSLIDYDIFELLCEVMGIAYIRVWSVLPSQMPTFFH